MGLLEKIGGVVSTAVGTAVGFGKSLVDGVIKFFKGEKPPEESNKIDMMFYNIDAYLDKVITLAQRGEVIARDKLFELYDYLKLRMMYVVDALKKYFGIDVGKQRYTERVIEEQPALRMFMIEIEIYLIRGGQVYTDRYFVKQVGIKKEIRDKGEIYSATINFCSLKGYKIEEGFSEVSDASELILRPRHFSYTSTYAMGYRIVGIMDVGEYLSKVGHSPEQLKKSVEEQNELAKKGYHKVGRYGQSGLDGE